eukprot:scaffold5773_cov116-Isochrysis_galbana.AAC.5
MQLRPKQASAGGSNSQLTNCLRRRPPRARPSTGDRAVAYGAKRSKQSVAAPPRVERLLVHVHLVDGRVELEHALRQEPDRVDPRVEAQDVAVGGWRRGGGEGGGGGHPCPRGRLAVHCQERVLLGACALTESALGQRCDDGPVAVLEKLERRLYAGVQRLAAARAGPAAAGRVAEPADRTRARETELLLQPPQAARHHELEAVEGPLHRPKQRKRLARPHRLVAELQRAQSIE